MTNDGNNNPQPSIAAENAPVVQAPTETTQAPVQRVAQAMPVNPPTNETNEFDILAIVGLVVSILNLCVSWTFCGCFFGLAGIICSAFGLKSPKYKTLAIVGLVLSILGMILTIIITGISIASGSYNFSTTNYRY